MTDPTPPASPPPANAPSPYRVELDAYAGPLDLLLYLVKRHEIDLNDIPVAQLTDQYLEHLKVIQQLDQHFDVDTAGEFLVMAATLLEVKSQMLMPLAAAHAEDAKDEDGNEQADAEIDLPTTDPRYELVQQLLAYKRFKDAAVALETRHDEWASRHAVSPIARGQAPAEEADNAKLNELDLEDVHVMDLCEAFSRILESIGSSKPTHDVTYDETPISLHADDIYDRLSREGAMTLKQIFVGRASHSEMIGLFLATLELVRQRRVAVLQNTAGGEIELSPRPETEHVKPDAPEPETATDWTDPETGEVQYAWPDEDSQKRAERRARLRAQRAEQDEQGDKDEAAQETEDDELD